MERQTKKLESLLKKERIPISTIIDITNNELHSHFLESTGSMVFDRVHKVAFSLVSPRSSKQVFQAFCKEINFKPISLSVPAIHKLEVYHTNLLMSIGSAFAVVCFEVLEDSTKEQTLRDELNSLGKTCIDITLEQVYSYCGNVLEVINSEGKKIIILSQNAYEHFTKKQRELLQKFGELLIVPVPTIEDVGGGSVRCMMAEVFPD